LQPSSWLLLVCIFQENDKKCPDNTVLGGFLTFEFCEPIEFVKLITLFNVKKGPVTPDVKVIFDGGKTIAIDMPDMGGNGVYALPFKTDLYQKVTRVEVRVEGSSGAISSLEYPYCARTPTTTISVKKYAGPPNLCTASGIRSMKDSLYTVPDRAEWAYCYEIRIPSSSKECLYGITLTDPAPIGGRIGTRNVMAVSETLCSTGQAVYIAGPSRSFSQVPEPPVDAVIQEGHGYHSGSLVTI